MYLHRMSYCWLAYSVVVIGIKAASPFIGVKCFLSSQANVTFRTASKPVKRC